MQTRTAGSKESCLYLSYTGSGAFVVVVCLSVWSNGMETTHDDTSHGMMMGYMDDGHNAWVFFLRVTNTNSISSIKNSPNKKLADIFVFDMFNPISPSRLEINTCKSIHTHPPASPQRTTYSNEHWLEIHSGLATPLGICQKRGRTACQSQFHLIYSFIRK